MKYEPLSTNIVENIKEFISNKEKEIQTICVNKIIKENVFDILDENCIVIYYPIEDKNNGFHTSRLMLDKEQNFVFINTSNPIEKQIFTAAHELGHIWHLDEYLTLKSNNNINLKNELGEELDKSKTENIMNRFAAELLMPEDTFTADFKKFTKPYIKNDTIDFIDFLRACVELMDLYFVPFNAIVIRICEINEIELATLNDMILENEKTLDNIILTLAKAASVTKLFTPNKKMGINELDKYLTELDKDENNNIFVENMRKKFDIPKYEQSDNDVIKIGNTEDD